MMLADWGCLQLLLNKLHNNNKEFGWVVDLPIMRSLPTDKNSVSVDCFNFHKHTPLQQETPDLNINNIANKIEGL